ncbi:MAG: bacteriophage abortive infection AbiH family protein [Erysipelotrichaceae bacterium]|nr:bacteriophage abortive infection AbiH family protein [Erysipelotrichaceae bacterium]
MKKLYVFGNGFDLRHNLSTGYNDFRAWLCEKNKNIKEIYGVPSYSSNGKGLEGYSDNEFISYFLPLIDEACEIVGCELWKDYENALGFVDWTKPLEDAELIYDKDGDLDPFNAGNNIEDMANDIYSSCHILSKLFREWIEDVEDEIDVNLKREEFKDLSNDDIYLNFNYTSTLETVYGIKNVKHIHGYVCDFNDLIVGHGNDTFDRTYFEKNDLAMNAEQPIEYTFDYFRKKTNEIIDKNKEFFINLSDVNEIFILGCSLNDIDKPYFIEIFKNVIPNSKVHLYVHNDDEYDDKCKYIIDIGKDKIIESNISNWKNEL